MNVDVSLSKEERNNLSDFLLAIGMKLEELQAEDKITTRKANKIKFMLKPLHYKIIMTNPKIKNNERLKRFAAEVCLDDYFRSIGFGKNVRIIE